MTTQHVPFVYDLMPLTERKIDVNGYLEAPARISRTGVQKYRARELRASDGQQIFKNKGPDDFVFIMRPQEEVLDSASIASFENLPITNGHPDPVRYPEGVTPANYKELAIGHVRDCQAGKDGYVHAKVHIRDEKSIQDVFHGKSQLSCGYGFDCESKAGLTPDGQPYDGVMRNIRGNHLATVYVARGGSGCAVADQSTSEEIMEKVKITVDGIEHQVSPEDASLVKLLVQQRDAAVTTLKEKETAHGAAVTKLATDHAAELGKLRETTIPRDQVAGLVAKQCALLADCAAHCPDVKTEGLSAPALRRAMIADLTSKHTAAKTVSDAVLAGVALDKATDEQVETVCNAVVASVRGSVTDEAARRDKTARAFGRPTAGASDKKTEQTAASDSEPEDLSDGAAQRRMSQNMSGGKAGK